jgi:hypothetical protein
MAYMEVRNVLQRAEELHQFVHAYAARRCGQAKDDYVEGIFRNIVQQEEELRQRLTEFEADAETRLLDTWLQFPGVEKLEEAMDELAAVDGDDDDVILQGVVLANEALVELYDQAIAQVQAPALVELLERLRELQDHHLRKMANSVTEFQQLQQ